MSISSELMQRISLLLRPLMENKDQRRGYLIRALGTDSTVLYSLRLDMSTNDFIPNLVNELVKFGEIDSGQPAICGLFKVIREDVGEDIKLEIDKLLQQITKQPKKYEQLNVELNNSYKEDIQEAGNIFDAQLFGRTEELRQLQKFILSKKYPLLILVGMTGIGKTLLAAKLIEWVKCQFQYVIWKNLRTASSYEDFLNDMINFLSVNSGKSPSPSTDRVQYLINYLKDNKCLIILDDLTEILDKGDEGQVYKEGWKQFGRFLEQTSLQQHQSTILITCHEAPKNLEEQKVQKNCFKFKVEGLKPKDMQIHDYGLYTQPGAEDDWKYFVNYYGGNPGILEIAAKDISIQYDGDVSKFLEYNCKYGSYSDGSEEINELLNKQFFGLNFDEKQVMYLLAIKSEPVQLAEIKSAIFSKNSCVEPLKNLSLIKENPCGYTQSPMVMDYVTEKIVNKIVKEIFEKKPRLINDYPLLDSQAKDYIKDVQKRRIIQPIINKLLYQQVGQQPIKEHLILMFLNWRQKSPRNGYMGGNIMNLLLQMGIDLQDADFSNVPIGHAELQDKELRGVNFSNSDLSHASFSESFGCIHSIVFSHNGKYFATAEANGDIRLWQTDTFKQFRLLNDEQSNSQIWSISFSPDTTTLASGGEDKTIRLWNFMTGEQIKEIRDNQCVYSIAFSQNGHLLVSAGDESIAIWDTISGRLNQEIPISTQVNSIAISKDYILAAGSQDGTVRLWDIKDCKNPELLHVWQEHSKTIRCVLFKHDDTTVASGSEDGTIKLWKINSDKSFKTLSTPQIKQVWTLAFNKDGQTLASGSCDENPSGIDEHHNIRLWNIDNGKCYRKLGAHKNQLRAISFCPQNQFNLLVSGGDDHTIKIWDVGTEKLQKTIQGYTNRIWSVAFSPCGKKLVSGSEDNRINIWDMQNKQCIQTLFKHTDWVWSVAFSPDGTRIASGSEDNTIRLWQLKNKQWLHEAVLKKHTDKVRVIAFSPDSQKLVSGGNDREVILWDLTKPKYPSQILSESHHGKSDNSHTRRILSLAFCPDGNFVASSSRDKTIRLWNLKTKEVDILGEHDNQVHSIAFSPDGHTLASGGFDNKLKLWDIKTQKCVHTFEEHEDRILCVAFHPDGIGLASGGHDKKIRLWSISNQKCIRILEGHKGAIESIVFCPKGGILVSSSQDQTIKIWDTWVGECIDTLQPDSRPYESMKIANVKGLNYAQIDTLIALGAIAY